MSKFRNNANISINVCQYFKKCQYFDKFMSIFQKHINISINLCQYCEMLGQWPNGSNGPMAPMDAV